MKAILNALHSKASGSSFLTAVGGRFFENEAPAGADYPYSAYQVVSRGKDRTFNSKYFDVLVQVSSFSSSSESTEILDIDGYQEALFDECTLSVTGHTFISMVLENTVGPSQEEHTTKAGTQKVWACHSTYRVTVKV